MTRPLARLRARAEAIFQRRVLLALRVLREQVNVPALARVLQSGLPSQAIATLPIDETLGARLRSDFMRIFRDTYESGGDQAARRLKATLVGKDIDYTVRVSTFAFDVLNRRGLDFLQRHGADRVTQITETTRQALRELLTRFYLEGVPALEQAKRIREVVGLTSQHAQAVENLRDRLTEQGMAPVRVERLAERKAWQLLDLRALTIARTEAGFAAMAGQRESWQQAADEGLFNAAEAMRVWTTADRPCDICEPLDNVEVGLDEAFIGGNGEPIMDPPAHPNCLPNDALITAADGIAAASQRSYRGDVIVLRTAAGNHLACTPNHPILTDRGWIPAHLLNVGGHVISTRGSQRMTFGDMDEQHMPARIEEIAQACRSRAQMLPVPVPVSAEDFHGDGGGSEVAVIWAERQLMANHDAALSQEGAELAFHLADMRLALFARAGALALLRIGHLAATHRTMRRCSQPAAVFRRCALHAEQLRFMAIAYRYAALTQSTIEDVASGVELLRQLQERGAGQVFADKIVNIDVRAFRGHVFNLQTRDGYYIANGIVTHNCLCTVDIRPAGKRAAAA